MKRTLVLIAALFALAAGTAHAALPGRNGDLAWSPDGRRLLVFDGSTYAMDLNGRMGHDFGLEDYDGAESIDAINGVDWRPLL